MNNNSDMFDIISNIEGSTAYFREIIDVATLFAEHLRREVEWLDAAQPYTVQVFINRFDKTMSMLSTILRELHQIDSAIQHEIRNGYSAAKIYRDRLQQVPGESVPVEQV